MGIRIVSKNDTLTLGYGDFYRIRCVIAGFYSSEFKSLYELWCRPFSKISNEEGNKQLELLKEKGVFCDEDEDILDFLFASDCGGKLSYKKCKRLYNLINKSENIIYNEPLNEDDKDEDLDDFKELLKDCVDNCYGFKWY
jgi:hypothetical protein